MNIKVLLQAKYIPDNYTVTKATGQKKYTITRKLPLYGDGVQIKEVDPNVMFLSSKDGVNIISSDTVLAIEGEIFEIIILLSHIKEEPYSHE